MEFVNLTRNVEIGANSYLLKTGGKSLIPVSYTHLTLPTIYSV